MSAVVAVDVGNTRMRAGVVRDQVVDPVFTTTVAGGAESVSATFDWCVAQVEADRETVGVGFCSVVESATQLWIHLVEGKRSLHGLRWVRVDHRSPMPFAIDVRTPETVGADRYANVAGAVARGLSDALVVDLGTANTYDVLLDRRFRGGLIAPGCGESHRALLERGSALPPIPFLHNSALVGRDTREAIEAGSFRQALEGVGGVIRAVREEVGEIPVLLTGGLAELLGPELPGRPLYLPELTLEGCAAIVRAAQGL
jgi:type III pantothenate kinase